MCLKTSTFTNEQIAENFAKDLDETIWKTRGARFIAARRLFFRDRSSVVSLVLISLYITFFTLFSAFYESDIDTEHEKMLDLLSITASIGLIAFSLIEYASDHQLNSNDLHNNAIALSKLRQRLKFARICGDQERIFQVAEEYEMEVEKTFKNHAPKDYRMFCIYKLKPSTKIGQVGWLVWYGVFWAYYWFTEFFIYILLCTGIPVVFVREFLAF